MTALRAPVVNRGNQFQRDVDALSKKYPDLEPVVREMADAMIDSWGIPHRPIGGPTPDLYAVRLDYPPHGSAGLGVFLLTYHATAEAHNKMRDPLRTYTLLSLVVR